MVEASDPWQTNDLGPIREAMLDCAAFGRIADRGVNALRVVVLDVPSEEESKVLFIQDDDVIQ